MIDHLIRVADMDEWTAVREQYGLHDGNSHHARVFMLPGTFLTLHDDLTGQTWTVEERDYLAYEYVWASLPDPSPEIAADPRCMIVADRDSYDWSDDFILYVLPSLVPDLMTYFIEPVPTTTHYPFG